MEESFRYFQNLATGLPDPHVHFKNGNEDCFADVVVNFKPLYYSLVKKFSYLGQETIFNVYIDCIYDCLKRFEEGKGKQTFGSYLKVALIQGCSSEITRNNCDKRKANIGTYNYDDIFDENTIIDSEKDKQKLDDIVKLCERRI